MTSDLPPTGGSQPPPEPTPGEPSGPAAASAPSAPTTSYDPPPASGSSGHASDDFFNRIRSAGVTRPDDGRWVAGVAAGLARRWDVDPILVRGGFVALSIFGGIGVIVYGLAWLLLPQDDGRIHVQQAIRGDITAGFIGALILSLAAIGGGGGPGPWHDGFWFGWAFPGGLLITAAVIFGIWWLAKRSSQNPQAPGQTTGWPAPGTGTGTGTTATGTTPPGTTASHGAPAYGSPSAAPGAPYTSAGPPTNAWAAAGQQAAEASRRAGEAARLKAAEATSASAARRARTAPSKPLVRLTLGIALLIAAAILVIGNAADWDQPIGVIAAASALAVVAAGIIASGLLGRRAAGLAGVGLLLTIGTLAGTGAENAGVRAGQNLTIIGSQVWEPRSPEAAQSQFNLGVGEATLWLTDPAVVSSASTSSPIRVTVRAGAGRVVVYVPEDVTTRFDLKLGAGEAAYPDGTTYRFNEGRGGNRGDGTQQRLVGPPGQPRIIVDIQQGAGQIDLRTASGRVVTPLPTPSAAPTPTGSARPVPTASVTPSPTAGATT
jgi:phage shock protein PspC (stress-responsive transcriptional regulator)